ncbi:MAG: DUF255 domain-containing protein [Ignavibacteria bacterium]|nr:DUF255 domain-containing protein [Ignavibacteria bacterium]
MKTKHILILFISSLLCFELSESQENNSKLKWLNFNDAVKVSEKSNKKLLVDVYTDWCSWCKKMDSNVYANEKVLEYLNKKFVVVKLNAEGKTTVNFKDTTYSAAEFSQGMGVTGYPATLFFTANGNPITLLPGYVEAPMFLNVLRYISESRYEKESFDTFLKSLPKTETK